MGPRGRTPPERQVQRSSGQWAPLWASGCSSRTSGQGRPLPRGLGRAGCGGWGGALLGVSRLPGSPASLLVVKEGGCVCVCVSLSASGSGCCPHTALCPVPVREGMSTELRATLPSCCPSTLQPVGRGRAGQHLGKPQEECRAAASQAPRARTGHPGSPGLGLVLLPAPLLSLGVGAGPPGAVAELLCPTGHEQVLGSLRERPGLLRVGCRVQGLPGMCLCVPAWDGPLLGQPCARRDAGPGRSSGPCCGPCASPSPVHPALLGSHSSPHCPFCIRGFTWRLGQGRGCMVPSHSPCENSQQT